MPFHRHISLAFAAFLVAISLTASPARPSVFGPETFKLANGMQVVVVQNHRIPVVTHMVWYKVGSADEVEGSTGISHFLEHLMFKGTERHPEGEFSTLLARIGGRENAFTSYDYTAYHQTVAKEHLALVMELEADRMTNLHITPESVETERQVVLEERRQRTDNDPRSILQEQALAVSYLNYPYRRPVIGWEHEIRALTLGGIMAFHARWYAPNNAILVISGDTTAKDVRPLAEKYYGVIPPGPVPQRVRPQEPPQRAAREVTLRDARVRQPALSRSYLAPSHGYGKKDHTYPLEVLATIISSGATSRLHRNLVVRQGLATTAGAWYDADRLGPSRFGFYISPRPGTDMATLEAAMMKEVDAILADGVSNEEVSRAKKLMLASAVYARDSVSHGARVLGAALASGQTVTDVESWPERIQNVTAEQIVDAARAVFKAEMSVTTRLLGLEAPSQ